MLCTRFVRSGRQIAIGSEFIKRHALPKILVSHKSTARTEPDDEDNSRPIQFSTSQAATWRAEHSRRVVSNRPWYQGLVVSGSVAVLMIYFCILREENDIDEMLTTELYVPFETKLQKNLKESGK